MAFHRIAHLVVAAAIAFAAVASAAPIRVTANTCQEITDAFALLSGQYANATTPSPLRLDMTFNCTADWSNTCQDAGYFTPSTPANSTKQPPVRIILKTNCKRGQNLTFTAQGTFISVDTSAVGAKVDVSATGFKVENDVPVTVKASTVARGTLVVKDVSSYNAYHGISAYNLDTVSISGGSHEVPGPGEGIMLDNITKRVTISKVTINGYVKAGILLNLPANTQVVATGNTITNADTGDDPAVAFELNQEGERISINLSKTTVDASASPSICITSPANVTKATVTVAGSTGFGPLKSNRTLTPAGFPVSGSCTVAEFIPDAGK